MTDFTPESPILSNFQFCRPLSTYYLTKKIKMDKDRGRKGKKRKGRGKGLGGQRSVGNEKGRTSYQ
jgi:hypothetical protein